MASVAVVLLMDVMEHVPDDRAFLDDVVSRRFVSGNTRFVITVPSYEWLFSSHDRLLGHYRRYSTATLTRQIQAAGLAVAEQGRFFATLLPVRAVQTLRERIFSPSAAPATALTTWRGGEIVARAIAAVLAIDARVLMALGRAGIKVPGSRTLPYAGNLHSRRLYALYSFSYIYTSSASKDRAAGLYLAGLYLRESGGGGDGGSLVRR